MVAQLRDDRRRDANRADTRPGLRRSGLYKNMNRAIIALVFRCKITGGQLSATDETEAFRWAAETDIRELASEAYAIRMLDALHDHRPAAVRQHDGKQLL